MRNPRLASRYAKSLMDVSMEQGSMDAVYEDMRYVGEVIKSSRDFSNLLNSPIVSDEKKSSIIHSILDGKISQVSSLFIDLLVKKKRSANLSEITEAFVEQFLSLIHI